MQFLQDLFSHNAWQLFGRFHVLVIHFPVALLLTVAFVEIYSIIRRRKTPSPAAFACLVIGSMGAIVAAVSGWAHAQYTPFPDQPGALFYHRWLGIATAVLALALLVFYYLARTGNLATLRRYQIASFVVAILAGITGHLGGTLTHGPDFLTITPPAPLTPTAPAATAPNTTTSAPATNAAALAGSYDLVQTILSHSCYFCHGPMKQRGTLRVDSNAAILQGGKNGPAIVPGDSEHSLLIRRCLGLDDLPRMPNNQPALPDDQIQTLRHWIDSLPPTTTAPATQPTP